MTKSFSKLIEQGVLEIGDGYRAKNDELGGDGLIFLRAGHVRDTHIDFDGVDHFKAVDNSKLRGKISVLGDVVITTKGNSTGRIAFVTKGMPEFVYSPHLSFWRSKNESVLCQGFLRAWSRGGEFDSQLQAMCRSTDMAPYLSLTDQKRLQITLPSIEHQREAAEILDGIEARITLLRETNATLETIAQALFKSWFVDFDPVRAKAEGRQPEGMDATTAALFPDSFEESELGVVPKGWEVKPVGDVVNVTDYVANGSFAALKENVTLLDQRSYALYVRTTDHNSGFCGGFRYVDKAAYDFLAKSSLLGNEVIISNVGDVGTVFRPPRWLGIPMTLGSNAVALKAPQMSAFLFFHFSGAKGQHDIHSVVTGSAQRKFNKTNFRSLKLLLPTESCLSEFEEKASLLLDAADNNRAKIQTFTQLRDTLLPRLISGQLRLPEAQALLNDRDIA